MYYSRFDRLPKMRYNKTLRERHKEAHYEGSNRLAGGGRGGWATVLETWLTKWVLHLNANNSYLDSGPIRTILNNNFGVAFGQQF
jgi:hypothetical protein